jgi:hypothetical protein
LYNLRVLLKGDQEFDLPAHRAAIPGDYMFKLSVSQKDINLKIPADAPDLIEPKYHVIRDFKGFLTSVVPAIKNTLENKG